MVAYQFVNEKKAVLSYYDDLISAPNESVLDVMSAHVGENYRWRGFHPFDEHQEIRAS